MNGRNLNEFYYQLYVVFFMLNNNNSSFFLPPEQVEHTARVLYFAVARICSSNLSETSGRARTTQRAQS